MRYGAQVVAGALAKRVTVLLLALGCLAVVGNPHGAGVAGGVLIATALICHATGFGVDATMKAVSAHTLRIAAVTGVVIAAGAGIWAADTDAFNFGAFPIAGVIASPGGALMALAALLVVVGASAFIFFCLAGRVTALGDGGLGDGR